MADSKEIKFSEDELKSLQEVQQNYQEMQVKMGGLKMQQIAHDRNSDRLVELEETLMTELTELNDKEGREAIYIKLRGVEYVRQSLKVMVDNASIEKKVK